MGGLSADGRTIVGTVRRPDGLGVAYFATIPAPASLALLLGGLSAFSIRRRR